MNMISKTHDKYSRISLTVRASIWFTMCNIIQKGIQFLTIPIYTRLLSTEDYGVYSVFLSWLNIVTIFATLNLSAGVFNNGMIKYENRREEFISSMQGLSTVITLFLFIVYILLYKQFNSLFEMGTFLVLCMFAQILFAPALAFWSARERFEFRYRKFVIVTLVLAIATPILSVALILEFPSYGVEAIIIGYVLVQVMICGIFYVRNFCKSFRPYNKEYWKFALCFNLPLLPHYLSQIMLNQSDRVMINSLCGAAQAGIYSVAYQMSTAMGLVTSGINSSFIPWTYACLKEKKYKEIGKQANKLLLLVSGLIILVVAVAPEIITIVSPKNYYEAIWIIPPVACSVYFTFLYTLFANIEFFYEENGFIMVASVISAVVNVFLNYVFINLYGYLAAGYTTLVCYALYAFGHYAFMMKVCKKHIGDIKIYDIKFIILIMIGMIFISGILMLLYPLPLVRGGIIIAVLGMCLVFRSRIKLVIMQMFRK